MAVYYDNTSLKAKHERKKSLEDVPANLRDAVAKLLEEDTNV